MKKILSYLPLFTICLVYFGFNSLHGYYREFGIDIYNYISNGEILMSFFPTILVLGGYGYTIALQTVINSERTKIKSNLEEISEIINEHKQESKPGLIKKTLTSYIFWFLIGVAILTSITYFVTNSYRNEPWELQSFHFWTGLIYLMLMLGLAYSNQGFDFFKKNEMMLMFVILLFIGQRISGYRALDAVKLKCGHPISQLSFARHGKTMKTDKNLLFVGQTQTQLFLYDIKSRSTLVFKQAEIDSLVIKN